MPRPFPACGRDHTPAALHVGVAVIERWGVFAQYLTAFDRTAQHEVVAAPAVVRASAVGLQFATEVRHLNNRDVVPEALAMQFVVEQL